MRHGDRVGVRMRGDQHGGGSDHGIVVFGEAFTAFRGAQIRIRLGGITGCGLRLGCVVRHTQVRSAKPTVTVSIKDWGDDTYTYHLNGSETPVQYSELEDDLVDLLQTEEDPTFSIYSDESVPIKEVVSLMNIAKRNHYKVILATQPE